MMAGTEKGFSPNEPSTGPWAICTEEARPPMTGPKTKPRPMAMPTTAMPFVRSFSSVMSAAAALATAMLPAIMPETRRVRTTTQNWAAKIQSR